MTSGEFPAWGPASKPLLGEETVAQQQNTGTAPTVA